MKQIIENFISGRLGGFIKINNFNFLKKILDKKNFACLAIPAFLTLFFITPALCAETLSYKSALVWRSDGFGDYFLPRITSESTYILNPGVVTDGLIKSVTATWKFEGEVDLEISADNGIHFTSVINGVPLTRGFTPGTSLKWKAKLGADSKLYEVAVAYTDSAGTMAGFANPSLSGFKYQKKIHIAGSGDRTLYNYQVVLFVGESEKTEAADIDCSGHISADFADVRFTLVDGETLLPYYLEGISGNSPNRLAEFFIKIPQVPPQGVTLYVYYDNSDAVNLSNPEATFDFYEDFRAKALDTEKWIKRASLISRLSLDERGLVLSDAGIISKNFEFKGGIIEYAATAETGAEARFILRDPDPNSETDTTQIVFASAYEGAQHCIAVGGIVKANDPLPIAPGKPLIYRVFVLDDDIVFERYNPETGKKQASISYHDAGGPAKGRIGFKAGAKNVTRFYYVRVRKYAQPMPAVDAARIGNEEEVLRPVYENMDLDGNGDLILAKAAQEGFYQTEDILAPYDIRILVPTWIGTGLTVDVSADSGESFKKNCRNETYYYAGRGDFAKEKNIRCVVGLTAGRSSVGIARLASLSIQYASGNITVLSPSKGETLMLGTQKEIIWSAWDYERSYPLKIEYSLDGGATYSTIAEQVANTGRYLWSVPDDEKLVTRRAKIRISDGYGDSVAGESDFFRIEAR